MCIVSISDPRFVNLKIYTVYATLNEAQQWNCDLIKAIFETHAMGEVLRYIAHVTL